MKFNKKGISPLVGLIIFLVALFGGIALWDYFAGSSANGKFVIDDYIRDKTPWGDAINNPSFNFVSYIFGSVPQALIDSTNSISAAIIVVLVWVILLLMFSDILTLFGTFSKKQRYDSAGIAIAGSEYSPTAWGVAIALTVIAANLNVVVMLASLGFILVSGVGVLAAVLGVLVPFVAYIVVHLLFMDSLLAWANKKRTTAQFKAGMTEIKEGITAFKEAGKAVRAP